MEGDEHLIAQVTVSSLRPDSNVWACTRPRFGVMFDWDGDPTKPMLNLIPHIAMAIVNFHLDACAADTGRSAGHSLWFSSPLPEYQC